MTAGQRQRCSPGLRHAHRSIAMADHDQHWMSVKALSVAFAVGIAVGIGLVVLAIWLIRHGL